MELFSEEEGGVSPQKRDWAGSHIRHLLCRGVAKKFQREEMSPNNMLC